MLKNSTIFTIQRLNGTVFFFTKNGGRELSNCDIYPVAATKTNWTKVRSPPCRPLVKSRFSWEFRKQFTAFGFVSVEGMLASLQPPGLGFGIPPQNQDILLDDRFESVNLDHKGGQ